MSVTGYNANQFYVKDGVLTSDVPIKAPDFIGPISPPSGNLVVDDLTVNGQMTIVNEPSIVNSTTYNYNNVVISNNSDTVPGLSITTTGDAPIFVATDGDSSESFVIENGGNVNINDSAIILYSSGGAVFTQNVTAPNIVEPGDLADLESKTQNINLALTVPNSSVFQSIIRVNDNETPSQTRIYMDAAYDTGSSIEARIVTENALLDRATIQDLNAPTLTSTDAEITTLTVNDDINAGVFSWNNGTQTLSLGVGTLDANAINVNTLITNTLQVNSGSLNMDSNRIINLAAPAADSDGTNRLFVENAIATAGDNYQPLNAKLTAISSATATSGNYLRGDGTNFVSSAIQAADLPSGIDATKIGGGGVSNFEYGCLDGVTQSIQNQINLANQAITDNSNDIADNVAAISVLDTKTQALSDNGSILSISHPISMGTNSITTSAIPSLGGDLINLTYSNANLQPLASNLTALAALSGNTSQYIRGDMSLSTFPTIPGGSMADLNNVLDNTYYVSAAQGNDSNNGFCAQSAKLTLADASSTAGNSGRQIAVFPGTYAENSNISALNQTISSAAPENGGLVNFTGLITFSHSSSSIRCFGITFNNLTHSGAGNLYLQNCRVNGTLTLSGSGYFHCVDCDLQGGSSTGAVSITGTGIKVFQAGYMGALSQNNAASIVTVRNAINSSPLVLLAGVLSVSDTPVFAVSSSFNAISTVSGSTLVLSDMTCLNASDGSLAKINIASGVNYSLRNAIFNTAASTVAGTNVVSVLNSDSVSTKALNMNSNVISNVANGSSSSDAVNKSQLDLKAPLANPTFTGTAVCNNLTVNGDCLVQGSTIQIDSTVNVHEYIEINQNPALSNPPLSIIQAAGGTGALFEITDSDSSIKFQINQDCDLALNTNKFTVDSSSGDTVIAGDCDVAGTLTSAVISATTTLAVPQGTGSSGSDGQIRYNTSLSQYQGYSGSSWTSLAGSSFNPTITSATLGDSLYYNGSSWVNGLYTSSPTITSSVWTISVTGNMVSPYSWNGTTARDIQIKIYSDSGLTTLVYDTGVLTSVSSWTGNNTVVSNSTTYYVICRQRASAYSNSWSPYSSYISWTTPSNNVITSNLTTSLSAYNAANQGVFVNITETEYNNISAALASKTVSGLTTMGNNTVQAPINQGAFCEIYNGTSGWDSWTNNNYFVAFTYTASGNDAQCVISTSPSNTFIDPGRKALSFTSTGQGQNLRYYYVIKSPGSDQQLQGGSLSFSYPSSQYAPFGRTNGVSQLRNYVSTFTAISATPAGVLSNGATTSTSDTQVSLNIQILTTSVQQW